MKNKSRLKRVSVAVGLLSLLVSGSAWAEFSTPVFLASVEVWTGFGSYVTFAVNPNNKPGCATTGRYQLTGTADEVKTSTSVATAAYLAGKPVKVSFAAGCVSGDGKINIIGIF